MVLLVAGSRDYCDYDEFKQVMDYTHNKYHIDKIVSGGARGADSLAERYAEENNIPIKVFPARWSVYGKSAGFIRNADMHNYLSLYGNRMCLCFWDGKSPGIKNLIELAKQKRIKVAVVNY